MSKLKTEESFTFLETFGEVTAKQKEIAIEQTKECVAVYAFHSGGGHKHLIGHKADGHLISIHFDDDEAPNLLVELSHGKWDSFDAYLEAGDEADEGFGWEFQLPDYEERSQRL